MYLLTIQEVSKGGTNIKKILIAAVVLSVVAIMFIVKSMNTSLKIESSLFASDDKYLSSPVNNNLSLKLIRTDDNGVRSFRAAVYLGEKYNEQFRTDIVFRERDALLVTWDDAIERFWVYSGDTGTSYWQIEDGCWIQHHYVMGKAPDVPAVLKAARPNLFNS